jgi:hypothetical protein
MTLFKEDEKIVAATNIPRKVTSNSFIAKCISKFKYTGKSTAGVLFNARAKRILSLAKASPITAEEASNEMFNEHVALVEIRCLVHDGFLEELL